jgi:hypothetical protein
MKVDYYRFSWGGLHGKNVVATGKGKTGTVPAFALGPRKPKKNLCRDGRSQDLPVSRHVSLETLKILSNIKRTFYTQSVFNHHGFQILKKKKYIVELMN